MVKKTVNGVVLRAVNFLKDIKKSSRVAIIHDTDPDGVCSAVIMAECVRRLGSDVVVRLALDKSKYGINPDMIVRLRAEFVSHIITTDFAAEQDMAALNDAASFAKVLVVDHHKLYGEPDSDSIILFKPQLFSDIMPSRYCTAKLAFDLASRVVDVSDLDWVAASACVADIATEPWPDFMSSVCEKYGFSVSDDWFKTKLGEVAITISSAEVYDVKLVDTSFKVVREAKLPSDVIDSRLSVYRKAIDKEVNHWLALFPDKAEKHGDLFIFEINPKYKVQSVISTILGLKYKDKTVILIDVSKDYIRVSARRNDMKIAVNNLLEQAVAGFVGANAGGHTPAAGAGFSKSDLAKFKERLISLAGK